MTNVSTLIIITFGLLLASKPTVAQITYLGEPASNEMKCEFYPMTSFTRSGFIMRVHSQKLTPEELSVFSSIFDQDKAAYEIKNDTIMIPCEYFSDIEYLMNLSSKSYLALKRDFRQD